MTLQGSLINVEEADAIIATRLHSMDPRRTAWAASSQADQEVCCRVATDQIAACAWRGRQTDAEQGTPFPRVMADGTAVAGSSGTAAAIPAGAAFTAWSVPSCPREVYLATAIQAARVALQALGQDDDAAIAADAQRGVTGRSGPGGSASIDLARAASPRSSLDREAWDLLGLLFAWGGDSA